MLTLLIDGVGDIAVLSLVQVEDALLRTAGRVAVLIAVAFVNGLLQNTCIPSVDEIGMVPVPSWISVRKAAVKSNDL